MKALLSMLRRRLMTVVLWQSLFVLSVIGGLVSHYVTVEQMMKPLRFVMMDSRSCFYLNSAGSFESEASIHCEIARMAAETIFERNPDGFDNPERLERLFNPETTIDLHKEASRDADVFHAQQIHQKIETGIVKEMSVNNNTALVSVEGQVLRVGIFNQKTVNDTKKVTVFLRLQVNDSMAVNGRYPLEVTKYEERFE